VAAGDYAYIQHRIEGYRVARLGWGGVSAQPITISFWISASIAGTIAVSVRTNPPNRSYVVDVPLAGGWEYKTVTIPGDTGGTWPKDNSVGMIITFAAMVGATYRTTANAWQAGNFFGSASTSNFFPSGLNTIYLTGVVVLPGTEAPSAARSMYIMRPFDQELALCQRYYCKSFPAGVVPANAAETQAYVGATVTTTQITSQRINYPVRMRAAPTVVFYSPGGGVPANGQWQFLNVAFAFNNAATALYYGNDAGFASILTIAGGTFGIAYALYGGWTADTRL